MKARTIRVWSGVHTWTSLVCTVFLLLLCLTGLPLLFHEEIDALMGNAVVAPTMPAGTPPASLDRVIAAAEARQPGKLPLFLIWNQDDPAQITVTLAPRRDAPASAFKGVIVDSRTASVLGEPDRSTTFIQIMFRLHVDLFAGLPGKLFLGAMGLVFLAAIVSGVVLYAPFMRRMAFGTVRRDRPRTRWLDLHNLVGAATLVWVLVVGATGVINTWADLVFQAWQRTELADMLSVAKGLPPLERLGSVDTAVAAARAAAPGMTPRFVAFPGTGFSSPNHYAVFLRGDTPLTARLLTPALVDAATSRLTAIRPLPWYATALLVSEPLHFGDYGGTPLRIIWALLDAATIFVLGSGVYLWLSRRRARAGTSRAPAGRHAA